MHIYIHICNGVKGLWDSGPTVATQLWVMLVLICFQNFDLRSSQDADSADLADSTRNSACFGLPSYTYTHRQIEIVVGIKATEGSHERLPLANRAVVQQRIGVLDSDLILGSAPT